MPPPASLSVGEWHGATAQGMAIIMISSELEEVLGMSDRIMVMSGGRSAGILPAEGATQEKIMALATGTTLSQPSAVLNEA